jgi:hypothetical protein
MGESQARLFEPTFNRSVKVETKDERITSDGGVLLLREADHRLGLVESVAAELYDPRRPDRIRYTLTELVRERIYGMAQGYSAQDDADRLAHDPAFKMAVWDRKGDDVIQERLASQPTQSRLVDILSRKGNREALRGALAQWTNRHLRATGDDRLVRHATVDVDSFPLTVYGRQAGGAYNGYYRETVYHPIVASLCTGGNYDNTRTGARLGNGFIHAVLRAGNVHTSQGGKRFLRNVIQKARGMAWHFDLRLDAGFTSGENMDFLTDEKVHFVGRLKTNARLDALAEPHLTRPAGRPPKEGYQWVVELGPYRADSWKHAQRLILVVVDRPDPHSGQLFLMPEYFFLVTNYRPDMRGAELLLEHYRQRGTFEDRLGEFNQAIGPHLSQAEFAENEVTFLLALLSYNLSSCLRLELETDLGGCWDLGRFRDYVLKAGGRVVKRSGRLLVYVAAAVSGFWSRLASCLSGWRFPTSIRPPSGPRPRPWMPPPHHAHLRLVLRD